MIFTSRIEDKRSDQGHSEVSRAFEQWHSDQKYTMSFREEIYRFQLLQGDPDHVEWRVSYDALDRKAETVGEEALTAQEHESRAYAYARDLHRIKEVMSSPQPERLVAEAVQQRLQRVYRDQADGGECS